ncbi:3-hydroxyacyl-ACP dehydratase FabZ family protein [Undibacterium sp. Ji67W]
MNETISPDLFLRQKKPFLFIDNAMLENDGKKIVGYRYFDIREKYFAGHFPDEPIVPGVLLLEAMAQLCRLWMNHDVGQPMHGYLAQIYSANFNRQIRPGDKVRIEARRVPREIATNLEGTRIENFKCTVYLGDTRCARAEIVLHQSLKTDSFNQKGNSSYEHALD